MKIKKVASKILIAIVLVSIVALLAVFLSGCQSNNTLSIYDLSINFNDEEKTLSCKENLTYENKTETVLNFICLNLYPNAFREESISSPVSLANQHKAYPNGLSFGKIEIENVSVLNNGSSYIAGGNVK